MYSEAIPKFRKTKVRTKQPLEQYNQTKDTSDYLWYTTRYFFFKYHSFVPCQCNSSFLSAFLTDKNLLDCLFLFMMAHSFRLESDDLPFRRDIRPVIQIKSTAHAMIGFANDAFVGNLDQVYNSHISQIAGTKLCTEKKKINNLLRYWAWK